LNPIKKIGLIINPIAGMGGMAGLKGTDGQDIIDKAINLGSKPLSEIKTKKTLEKLLSLKNQFSLITCPGNMGEDIALDLGFKIDLVDSGSSITTTSENTRIAVRKMISYNVDLILFSGGDGTARDIYSSLGNSTPVLGIPTGVKIQSSVFAISPSHAGQLCASFILNEGIKFKEGEVIDLNEENYRKGLIDTKLFGYLRIPFNKDFVQNTKSGTPKNEQYLQQAIAHDMAERMDNEMFYLIGPGSTTKALTDHLKIKGSLLGVDIVRNKKVITLDVSYQEIINLVQTEKFSLIITPIGGQGFIFGRGNQQLTPEILNEIDKENIYILATTQKLLSLGGGPFLIDTGDSKINQKLSGYYKVITGYHQSTVYKAIS
jgi:predicted polyphosphate/ATP-dependent NAD kinase